MFAEIEKYGPQAVYKRHEFQFNTVKSMIATIKSTFELFMRTSSSAEWRNRMLQQCCWSLFPRVLNACPSLTLPYPIA